METTELVLNVEPPIKNKFTLRTTRCLWAERATAATRWLALKLSLITTMPSRWEKNALLVALANITSSRL